ncbi:MAG: hypothetical protein APR54_09700 [Candidatus Cloacimonas sp. SDB]|nr:MAG: hypothetical protein APR54_09700 [Candidatus Cloacimonas sp. SDB]
MNYDVIIIGGGAAGMMAAGIAAAKSDSVLLLEKNPILGKKLFLTGKGRCNLTNLTTVENLIAHTVVNGKFLRNAYFKFNAEDTVKFFEELGLKTKIERGNRVFPKSDKSSDVIKYLKKYLIKNNIKIINQAAVDVTKKDNLFVVELQKRKLFSHKLILATGGRSYTLTGSTGDGHKFAEKFGHTIRQLKPSLVPIETIPAWNAVIDKLKLKNVKIKIIHHNKVVFKDFGEMEICGSTVSGPVILSASSYLKNVKNHQLIIDLKPGLTEKQLDERLIREFNQASQTKISKILNRIIPLKLKPVMLELAGIDPGEKCGEIAKSKRKQLGYSLKNLKVELSDFRSFDEAIITSGGICVDEIDPRTMESKIVKDLYFAGEIIDVDALTGGFNLQIAWSTAYTAGVSC